MCKTWSGRFQHVTSARATTDLTPHVTIAQLLCLAMTKQKEKYAYPTHAHGSKETQKHFSCACMQKKLIGHVLKRQKGTIATRRTQNNRSLFTNWINPICNTLVAMLVPDFFIQHTWCPLWDHVARRKKRSHPHPFPDTPPPPTSDGLFRSLLKKKLAAAPFIYVRLIRIRAC